MKDWWYFLGIPLLGFLYKPHTNYISLLINLIACVPLLAFAYSLNDFFEGISKSNFLIPLIAFISTIIFLFLFDKSLHFITYLFLILMVGFYSMPLFALKRIPFVSTICNVIGPPLLIIFGINELDGDIFRLIFIVSCIFLMAQVFHELADWEEDKRKNIVTTIQVLGGKNFMIVGMLFLFLAFLISLVDNKVISLGIGIMISSAIYNFLIYVKEKKTDFSIFRKRYKITGLITGIFWAIFLLKNICILSRK